MLGLRDKASTFHDCEENGPVSLNLSCTKKIIENFNWTNED